jgi:hypothetical protein
LQHRLLQPKIIQFPLTFKDNPCKVQNNLNIIFDYCYSQGIKIWCSALSKYLKFVPDQPTASAITARSLPFDICHLPPVVGTAHSGGTVR